MKVLDLDLDFFLTDCCPLAERGERPNSDCAEPWKERDVVDYLEQNLRLDSSHPIPGVIMNTHDQALRFWQNRMKAGILEKPFSVAHVDAHSDLGIGYPGPGFVLNNVLGIPPDLRDDPDRYYLLFAIAFRWIDSLTLVRDLFSRKDFPSFIVKSESGYQPIRLTSYVSQIFEKQYGVEPEVKLQVFHDPYTFVSDEPFTFINLACSPRYTPIEADRLIPIISRYMSLESDRKT